MDKGVYRFGQFITSHICLEIPDYQRHYSWGDEQWDDLWNDIYYLDVNKTHYFGAVILMEKHLPKDMQEMWYEKLDIIDGQQRIATLLILIREIIAQLESTKKIKIKRINKLKEDYLRYEGTYKLELLGDDREFFRRSIIEGEDIIDVATPSQERLQKAKIFFEKKLEELKLSMSIDDYLSFLLVFIKKINMMEIMVYPIKETIEAARMFELINDRGKELTNLEKTKSYLMYMVYLTANHKEQNRYLRDINDCFGNIYKHIMDIQNTKFGVNINEDDIQRYHFIIYSDDNVLLISGSQSHYSRQDASTIYMKILKSHIMKTYRINKEKCLKFVIDYAKDLENSFSIFKDILYYNKQNDINEYSDRIFLLNRPANFYPLLLSSWNKYRHDENKIINVLKLIEIIIFRLYGIGKRRSDTGRNALYDLSYKLHKNILNYTEIIDELKDISETYEWDRLFINHLSSLDFYSRITSNDIKYLFYLYESYLRKLQKEPLEFKLDEILSRNKWGRANYEIEHIWPQNTSALNLKKKELEEHEEIVHSLGNLTLASTSWNRSMGNLPFSEKTKKYKTSNIKIQRMLAGKNKWGKVQIQKRTNEIIIFALEEWKF